MQLYLIRHPRPQVRAGICYGQTDLSLAEDVVISADLLRADLPVDVPCFTSPLQRCRLLAEALYEAPVADARLMEMHFGQWEMQAWDDIPRDALDAWAADPLGFAPPDGESANALRVRVLGFLTQYQHLPALVLVTHGGVIKLLAGLAAGESASLWQARKYEYGALLPLQIDPLWHNAGHD